MGLGCEFGVEEFVLEGVFDEGGFKIYDENWWIVRVRNKWYLVVDCGYYFYFGIYLMIVIWK